MKKPYNKIFGEKSPITREDLQLYASGNLTGEKLHTVEAWIAENGLEAEAIEGMIHDPSALSALPQEPSFLNNKQRHNASGTLFTLTVIIAVLSTSLLTYILISRNNHPLSTGEKNITGTTAIASYEETAKEQIREIEESEPIEIKEQITYATTVKNQPETKQAPEPDKEIQAEKIPEINPENISEKKSHPVDVTAGNKIAFSNVKFKYIVDLKVIDYSKLYTSSISKTEIETNLSGVSAEYENKESVTGTEPEIKTIYIPYEEFLEEALGYFKSSDYKSALKNFKIIHKHYPEDLNAFFYGGLCYYNLNKCEKAIVHFDKCINGSFNTFAEEAEWYKALSLIRCKEKEQALELLQSIKNADGFYSDRADEMIKKEK